MTVKASKTEVKDKKCFKQEESYPDLVKAVNDASCSSTPEPMIDNRNIKRRIRPIPGFGSFRRVQTPLAAIGLIYMIKKGQY